MENEKDTIKDVMVVLSNLPKPEKEDTEENKQKFSKEYASRIIDPTLRNAKFNKDGRLD